MAMILALWVIVGLMSVGLVWLTRIVEQQGERISGLHLAMVDAFRTLQREQHEQERLLVDHIKGTEGNGKK